MVDADLGITFLPEMAEGSALLAGTRVETYPLPEPQLPGDRPGLAAGLDPRCGVPPARRAHPADRGDGGPSLAWPRIPRFPASSRPSLIVTGIIPWRPLRGDDQAAMNESSRRESSTGRDADTVRSRHGLHFNDCEATGQHSSTYVDFLCRDIGPHLVAVLRELETRASMVLAGEPRRRVLSLLYDWQDGSRDRLASFFIQCTDAESPWQLGFGHVGSGYMGITDPSLWQQHIDEFRENVWITVVRESRKSPRRSAG